MNERFTIPRRLAITVAWTSLLYVGYQVTNRWHLVPPRELPLTPLDRAIPFLVWSVVPYFVLIGGVYLPALIASRALFLRTLAAMAVGVLANYAIFTAFPTTYPRPPLPEGHSLAHAWYAWLVSIDTPANCFPSGHITSPAIGCWALAREHPRARWAIRLGFVPFALSILTMKQHYVVDLFGGLVTAALGVWASGLVAPWRGAAAPTDPEVQR